MRPILTILLAAITATCMAQPGQGQANGYPYGMVPFTAVKITPETFFGQRIAAAQNVTIPLAFSKCESEGRYANFEKAAHPSSEYDVSSFMGFPFDDTDVYKTIEGASYVLQTYPDKRLEEYIDSILDIVAAAQESDGYLYTARTINPENPHSWSGDTRWSKVEILSHELYNLGHMLDAACAHYYATGSKKFVDIARRYADCVIEAIGPGDDQLHLVPGHQIAEMGLARLYLLTGERKYLDEAKYFLDMRGKTACKDPYSQSSQPVIEQSQAMGHAVRAGYMYSGMADVAALTGDTDYINAIDRIWENIVGKKYYITGGVGARHEGEAFGGDYELPNLTAYNETCAAISMVYFNYRMFLLHGESKYFDCLERTLYNGVFSGMSIDGGRFFYPNPLECDGVYRFNADNTIERQPWFGCACCPSNLCRFIPSLPGYIYAVNGSDLYVNLFAGNTATVDVAGGRMTLEQTTDYPWAGDIEIGIKDNTAGNVSLRIRIPGWVRGEVVPSDLYSYADKAAPGYTVSVNGKEVKASLDRGYFTISREWKAGDKVSVHFDMEPRLVEANANVKDDLGRVAVERGPLVYCAEWIDNADDLPSYSIADDPDFKVVDAPDVVGGIKKITAATDKPSRLTLVPYYAWNHRGIGKMQVWIKK